MQEQVPTSTVCALGEVWTRKIDLVGTGMTYQATGDAGAQNKISCPGRQQYRIYDIYDTDLRLVSYNTAVLLYVPVQLCLQARIFLFYWLFIYLVLFSSDFTVFSMLPFAGRSTFWLDLPTPCGVRRPWISTINTNTAVLFLYHPVRVTRACTSTHEYTPGKLQTGEPLNSRPALQYNVRACG